MAQGAGWALDRQVNELNERFHAHARQASAELGAWFERTGSNLRPVRDAGLLSIGDRLPVPPALLPRGAWSLLGQLHTALRAALAEIFRHRFRNSTRCLADEIRLGPVARRYLDGHRAPHWLTIARPDVVLRGDGFAIVEPNAGSSCGAMPDTDILGRLFESSPVIGDHLRTLGAVRPDAMASMADFLRHRLDRLGLRADSLVVVAEHGTELSDPEFYHCDVFASELRRHGLRAEVSPAESLEVSASGVRLGGERCGLVYRMCGEQPDPEATYPVLGPLVDAGRRNVVAVVDDLGDQIAGDKTILAVLSEELDRERLDGSLRRRLRDFVPWTRLLEDGRTVADDEKVDLLPWCIANQRDLVLKPGTGFQGRGVTIGCESTSEHWAATVEQAVGSAEPWLVQRLVRSDPHPVSVARDGELTGERTYVDWGYYAVGDTVPAAAIRRNSPPNTFTRRIKRAGITPVFVV